MDCSNTLVFSSELKRMCHYYNSAGFCNRKCPFSAEKDLLCPDVFEVTQRHIDAVQRWSDEHPKEG